MYIYLWDDCQTFISKIQLHWTCFTNWLQLNNFCNMLFIAPTLINRMQSLLFFILFLVFCSFLCFKNLVFILQIAWFFDIHLIFSSGYSSFFNWELFYDLLWHHFVTLTYFCPLTPWPTFPDLGGDLVIVFYRKAGTNLTRSESLNKKPELKKNVRRTKRYRRKITKNEFLRRKWLFLFGSLR